MRLRHTIAAVGAGLAAFSAALPPAMPASAQATLGGEQGQIAPGEVSTKINGSAYDVYVGDKLITSVPVGDPAFSVATAVSADARRLAVIPNHDGIHGSEISSVDVTTGKGTTIDTGPFASAAFSEDSASLAYVTVEGGTSQVLVGDGTGPGVTVSKLSGRDVKVLGWDVDDGLYVTFNADVESDARYAATLARIDTRSGDVQVVLASDPAQKKVYADFSLARVKGEKLISFVRSEHVYPCGGNGTTAELARLDGTSVASYRSTGDLRKVVWSDDAARVAYEGQACVREGDAKEDALARLDRENGIYVADVATGSTRQAVRGLSAEYHLTGLADDTLRLSSARQGTRSVSTIQATPLSVDTIEDQPPAPLARVNHAVYIHQLWDTKDSFPGHWSCGPTSAVSGLADYQLGHWGIQVSRPWAHWSPFGRYITDTYAYAGTTFNRGMPGPNGSWATGAHGWILEPSCNCAGWARESDYIRRHIGNFPLTQTMADANWVRARLNEDKLVIVSGNFVWGRYGHLSVITGYTDDGRFYVHDTYGNGTDGSYDGRNSVYTWDYMRPKQFWAF